MSNENDLSHALTLVSENDQDNCLKEIYGKLSIDLEQNIIPCWSGQVDTQPEGWRYAVSAGGSLFVCPSPATPVTFTHYFTRKTATLPGALVGLIVTGHALSHTLLNQASNIGGDYKNSLKGILTDIVRGQKEMAMALGCNEEYSRIFKK